MDIGNLSENLKLGNDGIWRAPKSDTISYTRDGHQLIKDCEEGSFWFGHRRDCISILADKFKIKSLLDVGGGNGGVSDYLQKKGIHCALLEPGSHAIINAKSNGINVLINSSLYEAKFKSNTIDSVGIFDVLEHIEDDLSFIQEINRILKPGGRLLITVPAYMFLFSYFDNEAGHFRRYTLKNLKHKLQNNGFEIDYKTYLFSLLPIPMYFYRLFSRPSSNIQTRRNKEHFKDRFILNEFFRFLLRPEKWLVKWGLIVPFGSSCLVVAKKRAYVE